METKQPKSPETEKVELRPDGERRFERAIDIAVKTPAIRKEATKKASVIKRQP